MPGLAESFVLDKVLEIDDANLNLLILLIPAPSLAVTCLNIHFGRVKNVIAGTNLY